MAGRAVHLVLRAGPDLLAARGLARSPPGQARLGRPRRAVAGAAGRRLPPAMGVLGPPRRAVAAAAGRRLPAAMGVPGPLDGDAAPDRAGPPARAGGIGRQDHD